MKNNPIGYNPIGRSGIGYITVPEDSTREEYIAACYRTQTVTIQGGYGYSYIYNVRVLPTVMPKILFPETSEERGSIVFWIKEATTGLPIIVGIIPSTSETNLLIGGQERFAQEIENKTVEIFLDANTPLLNLNVVGNADTPARINLKVSSNGNPDTEINIESDGKINLSAPEITANASKSVNLAVINSKGKDAIRVLASSETLEFKATMTNTDEEEVMSITGNEEKMEFKDLYGNSATFNEDGVKIIPADKLNINDGSEPMVLGQTLVNILGEILDGIAALTVMTPVGTSSVPANVATFTQIKGKLNDILSQISNLD